MLAALHRLAPVLAVVLLVGVTAAAGAPLPTGAVTALGLCAAFLVVFALPVLGAEVNLSHVVIAGGALLYGPAAAGWAALLGGAAGLLVRRLFASNLARFGIRPPHAPLFLLGAPVFALLAVAWVFPLPAPGWAAWLVEIVLFGLVYGALLMGEAWLRGRRAAFELKSDFSAVALMLFLPAPFIVLAVAAYPLIQIGTLIALGGIPAIISVLIVEMAHTRQALERRLAQLSELNREKDRLAGQAELYYETQHRLREQSILYLVSAHLAEQLDPDGVMHTLGRALSAAVEGAQVGLYRHTVRNGFRLVEVCPQSFDLPQALQHASTPGAAEILFSPSPLGFEVFGELDAWCASHTPGRGWVFPLSANRQALGLALLWTPGASLQEGDRQLLQAIVSQAAVNLQNARLYADLQHSHARLAAVIDSVEEGLVMVERAGEVALANEPARKLANLAADQFEGQNIADLPAACLRRLGYTPSGARRIQGELAARTALEVQGEQATRHYERRALPVLASGGEQVGALLVYRDVTEEVEIAQARELLTETLVHDLRSPLTSILSALEFVDAKTTQLPAAESCAAPLQAAGRSVQRLLKLVETLLDISAMQAGSLTLASEELHLSDLGQAAAAESAPLAAEYGVSLRFSFPANLPAVNGDADKLSRVLGNLIDNALKFSPGGEEVLISARPEPPGMVTLLVSDRGLGVPTEYRQKIFDRFSQVPGQRGRRRGSGLGLAFCQLVVAAHGGQIWVEPRSGGGSIFNVTLPCYLYN